MYHKGNTVFHRSWTLSLNKVILFRWFPYSSNSQIHTGLWERRRSSRMLFCWGGEPGQGQQGSGLTDKSHCTWTRRAEQDWGQSVIRLGSRQVQKQQGRCKVKPGSAGQRVRFRSVSYVVGQLHGCSAPQKGNKGNCPDLMQLLSAREWPLLRLPTAPPQTALWIRAAQLRCCQRVQAAKTPWRGSGTNFLQFILSHSLIAARKWETTDLTDLGTAQRVTCCPTEVSIHTVSFFPLVTSHTYQIGCDTLYHLYMCITQRENIFWSLLIISPWLFGYCAGFGWHRVNFLCGG